jgi:putative membrane protein
MPVSDKEQQEINSLVLRFAAGTGVEAVAAVVRKADSYPEIPWKAFALGSAVGALATVMFPLLVTGWSSTATAAYAAMAILGAGSVCAAAAVLVPPFGRLFLDRVRAQAEARQYAHGIFLEREVFRTRERNAVLLIVARLEGVALILPDTGLAPFAPADELEQSAAAMGIALKAHGAVAAFECGFKGLEAALRRRDYRPQGPRQNVLHDAMLAEQGP